MVLVWFDGCERCAYWCIGASVHSLQHSQCGQTVLGRRRGWLQHVCVSVPSRDHGTGLSHGQQPQDRQRCAAKVHPRADGYGYNCAVVDTPLRMLFGSTFVGLY